MQVHPITRTEFIQRIDEAGDICRWSMFRTTRHMRWLAVNAARSSGMSYSDLVQDILCYLLHRLTKKPIWWAFTTVIAKGTRWHLHRILSKHKRIDPWNALRHGDYDLDAAIDCSLLKDAVCASLKTLTYREREIVKLRWGLSGNLPHTLAETGRVFKLKKERVRQIESKAIRKLQHATRSDTLRKFVDVCPRLAADCEYTAFNCTQSWPVFSRSDSGAAEQAVRDLKGVCLTEIREDEHVIWRFEDGLLRRVPQHPRSSWR